jgi:hypothetical protein
MPAWLENPSHPAYSLHLKNLQVDNTRYLMVIGLRKCARKKPGNLLSGRAQKIKKIGKGEKMGFGFVKPRTKFQCPLGIWFLGFSSWNLVLPLAGAFLVLFGTPSFGQQVTWGQGRQNCKSEPCPVFRDYQPGPAAPEAQAPSVEQPGSAPTLSPERFAALEGENVALASPNMIGDILVPSGSRRVITVTTVTGPNGRTQSQSFFFTIPAAGHGFKIADDGNPLPQDRVFLDYNFFNNVNTDLNRRLGADIHTIDVNREVFGLEKTFLEGNASLSVLFPLNTLSTEDGPPVGLGGSWTDVGDLTVVLKGVLWQDRSRGDALAIGLAVTFPTGADSFARTGEVSDSINNTSLQPFLGLTWNLGDFYVMGFSAVEIPTDSNDVTLFFNDIGIGYYVYRGGGHDQFLTAVVPTIEVHGNTPLNHRGLLNGPAGTPDWLDVTGGATIQFKERATLAIGVATPLTGIKPFDVEGIVQMNVHF